MPETDEETQPGFVANTNTNSNKRQCTDDGLDLLSFKTLMTNMMVQQQQQLNQALVMQQQMFLQFMEKSTDIDNSRMTSPLQTATQMASASSGTAQTCNVEEGCPLNNYDCSIRRLEKLE